MPEYASKYYDPQKAHQYYMSNRHLKGYANRYGGSRGSGTSAASTPGFLSDSKRAAAITKQHNKSLTKQIAKIRGNTAASDSISSQKEALRLKSAREISNIQGQIKDIQDSLKNMSREDRKANKDSVKKKIRALRDQIKGIRSMQESTLGSLSDQQHRSSLDKQDAIQRLRQQTKGGSTAGFNKKGMETARYVKQQMAIERDGLTRKTNKALDKKMLGSVKKFVSQINAARKNGESISNDDILRQLNSMASRVSRAKRDISRQNKAEYQQHYRNEVDKIRQDDSMFSYWDKRAKNEKRYAKKQKFKAKLKAIRDSHKK